MKIINSVFFDTNPLPKAKTSRRISVVGDVGAVFSIYVTKSVSPLQYYNFKTKAFQTTATRLLQQEIRSETKTYTTNIVFPAVTSDTGYNVYVYAESHFETEFNRDFEESLLYKVKNADTSLNDDDTYYLTGTTSLPDSIYQFADKSLNLFTVATSTVIQENVDTTATNTNLTVENIGGIGNTFKISKTRGTSFNTSKNRIRLDTQPNKVSANFLATMGTANNSMQLARQPILKDFFIQDTFTIAGTAGDSNSASTTLSLVSVKGIKPGDVTTGIATGTGVTNAGALAVTITAVDRVNKTVTVSANTTAHPGNIITFKSKTLDRLTELYGWKVKITNLAAALGTVDHPDTGQPTEFNFVTTKKDSNLTTGTTVDITSTKGLGTGDSIFAAGLTTADGTPDGTPITVASIVDSDTITISAALANNSTILENTQMFFKGSSLTAKISYDLEILQVGDRDVRIQLDLDNILTITDES